MFFLFPGFFNWTESSGASDLSVNVQVPGSLTRLEIKGLSDQSNGDCLQGAEDIIVSDLDNNQFLVTMDGSSDIRITGRTRTFTVNMKGAGDLDASGFRAETVLVTSRGAGDAIVHADREIKAVLDGAGDVTYLGSPDGVTQSGDGIGDLSRE